MILMCTLLPLTNPFSARRFGPLDQDFLAVQEQRVREHLAAVGVQEMAAALQVPVVRGCSSWPIASPSTSLPVPCCCRRARTRRLA